jgi:peptidoglycan hydrolase-like protein with peptidoglycan-binding domain
MKRTTLFVAVACALSLSAAAYAHGDGSSSRNESSWSQATRRVESMSGRQGQNAGLVKQAQEKLANMGKDVGKTNGQMNSKTERALTEYQQENGLRPTGQLDRRTIAALDLNPSASD